MDPTQHTSRATSSRRQLVVFWAVTLICLAIVGFWVLTNLNWIRVRNQAVNQLQLPVEGTAPAPWPLGLFGARGYSRVTLEVAPEKVAQFQEEARKGKLQIQEDFPEVEVIVRAKSP